MAFQIVFYSCWVLVWGLKFRYNYDVLTRPGSNDILSTPNAQWFKSQSCGNFFVLEISISMFHNQSNSIVRSGMLKAVQLCLQVRPDGLTTAGVPCHSFVWVNSGTAQRTHDSPFGREDLDYIAGANTIATRTCLLWMLCTVRSVYFFTEQPSSSKLFNLPYVVHVMSMLCKITSVWKSFLQLV